jgi:hypothetical protein
MNTQPATLLSFLNELRRASIHFDLCQIRDDAILVKVAVPGERWEIEFLDDGSVEVEIFRGDGEIHDAAILEELLARHSD